jgi:hypothetical protein
MEWSVVDIGKYKGKCKILPQVVFDDPDWFFWAYRQGVFRGQYAAQAEYVYRRARRIRVPPDEDGELLVVEYTVQPKDGKFAVMECVPPHQPWHARSIRDTCIDLGFPAVACPYDKTGGRLIVRAAKSILFGSSAVRMTAGRAAAFFEDDGNFDLRGEGV